jgi:hypothetical protein
LYTLDDFKTEEELDDGNKIFHDGEYTVWSSKADKIEIGDIIYLTTASSSVYDCVYGCFMSDIRKNVKVKVEILMEDLSEYIPCNHNNMGGCHGYASARVLEVIV